jgi:eukaryotic-like serine/threonine-protein kinase
MAELPRSGRDPLIDATIDGRWRILHQLGVGAFGTVYLAERAGLGRQVALKLLHEEYSTKDEHVRRFAREARALSRLQHLNCVSVLDVGQHGDRPYIVMELVAGNALTEEIGTPEMTPVRAVALMRQVLQGVGHAHGHGIIHRDLKPDNVMITELDGVGEVVKILDYGFAHINDARLSQSNANIVPGTPSYMSPEQANGIKTDPRTDLYAAGVILYELCAGFRPFVASEAFAILQMHRDEPPIPPRTAAAGRGISEALDRVILRALAKSPDERFADAAAFVAALDETPEGQSARAGSGAGGRGRLIRYAVVGAIILLASLAIVAATRLH